MQVELKRRGKPSLWCELDDADRDIIQGYSWHSYAKPGYTHYAVATISKPQNASGRGTIHMHTLLTGWSLVDHIDGNGLNNTRSNLREATRSQNQHNLKSVTGSSSFKGVCAYNIKGQWTGKWKAYMTFSGKHISLGYFTSEEEAALAYDRAALAAFGQFARLNNLENF